MGRIDPEESPRDWHSMSEEERMEILSHLSDMQRTSQHATGS
ncbi:hypothetical protein OH492_19195 [Vibrio chagasii]|nr:hypothetical protein [Vibrio chagasii]